MTVEEFFGTIAKVATWMLPVVGLIALVYLALVFKNLNVTLKEVNKTLDDVRIQVRKLDTPLNTVEELCHTVDDVHNATKQAANSAIQSINDNKGVVKEWFMEKADEVNGFIQGNKESEQTEIKEEQDNG